MWILLSYSRATYQFLVWSELKASLAGPGDTDLNLPELSLKSAAAKHRCYTTYSENRPQTEAVREAAISKAESHLDRQTDTHSGEK